MSYEQIPGWFSSEIEYSKAVERTPDGGTIVEIGVALGRSIAFLAQEVLASGKTIHIVGIDPWLEIMGQEQPDKQWIGKQYPGPREAFEGLMAEHAPREREIVEIVQGYSWDVAPQFPDLSLDFVFVDGCHEYDAVKRDISTYLPKMKMGAIMAGDDFSNNLFPGVIRAVQESFFVHGWKVRGVTWWVDL